MSYRCHNFCNGEVLRADPLNEMEQAIVDLENRYHNAVIIIPEHGNEISVADASESPFVGMTICGKTTQNGTPTPEAPIPLVSVGNGGSIAVTISGVDAEQTVSVPTPGGLPGVPVDGGWISDEIDLGRGVYVQRVNKIVLTGAESWLSANTISNVNVLYLQPTFPLAAAETGLCSHFPYDRAKAYSGQEGYIGAEVSNVTGKSRLWVSTTMTAAEFKSFLAEHQVTLIYPMAEPVETELDADLLSEFAKLHSYKPNTTVYNDAGADMTLEYVADTKTYVDNHGGNGGNVDLTGYATEQWVQQGFQPAGNYALKNEIPSIPVQSVNGKTGSVSLTAADVKARPENWMPTAQDVGALPSSYTPPNQTAEQVGADPKGTAANAVSQHNTDEDSHNDIRLALKSINDRLTAFFDSDDQTLDELSEIVAYITSNKSLIDAITTSKVNVADIINNLTTNVSNKPLSAAQGVVLKGLIDTLSGNFSDYQPKGEYALASQLPTKVSQLENDKQYLTSYAETDPTVPAWAKETTKPRYSKSEVGLGNVENVKQYSASNPPPYPVTSVNGETGDVTVSVPTKVSQLQNDSGYLTHHQDISGLLPRTELPAAVNDALAQAAASGAFDGEDGRGVKSITRTAGNGAAGTTDTYTITYTDNTTSTISVYNGKNGTNGTSVTVKSVSESTADGGSNVITFSDGKIVTIKNGSTGSQGADYVITDADKDELLAEVRATANQQTPLFANSVAECADTSKVYVLPDGYIYGYVKVVPPTPEITIEAKTGGYWGYSADTDKFQWATDSGWNAKLSNRIPVTPGDQLSYQGKMQYSGNRAYVWYNASGVEISSQTGVLAETAPVTITAPANAAYLQCSSFSNSGTAVLEINWILCQAAAPKYAWASTGHAFVPANYENRILALESNIRESVSVLKGKKIVYDGDSICESRTGSAANNGGGYAKLIANRVGGTYVNQAVSGARLTTAANGATYHSVVDNLPNLPTDGALYCFEGGVNDYWTPKVLGTFSKTDFTGTLDTNTICGALETIFRYALANFVGKPICFVIVHKIQSTAYVKNANGDTFEDYHNAMVGICNKYSIPYYDAFSESGLNGWNTAQNNAYLTSNSSGTADGIHPNEEGYKRYYVPQLISLFERIMPIE